MLAAGGLDAVDEGAVPSDLCGLQPDDAHAAHTTATAGTTFPLRIGSSVSHSTREGRRSSRSRGWSAPATGP
jgi:hypothetical protein